MTMKELKNTNLTEELFNQEMTEKEIDLIKCLLKSSEADDSIEAMLIKQYLND